MSHSRRNPETLLEALADFESLVEVGIGRRSDIAAALAARGASVTATDVHDRSVPDGVRFVRDDIVDPDLSLYEGFEAIYAQNLPPELHRPALEVAREVDAAFLFTTLGGDQPAVPVERVTIDAGTLYVARSSESR
ncbi:UPF0146 family protein [Natronorubrum daqingense]|uniref:UPF0146 protein BB347_15715 n=1 Tax=Natronorubrum daqingense TaxID=588898 RepID=A0A1N7AM02_9EURY|nr:UPF0146 family protein [Natronorubrum daqingense]APX97940.1 hypothetical protein BB347_15715 [Natronorubrum daqingense]SIR40033.1 hypothetical protein SAMN05421809_1218 [Natronorubrum daqingense]